MAHDFFLFLFFLVVSMETVWTAMIDSVPSGETVNAVGGLSVCLFISVCVCRCVYGSVRLCVCVLLYVLLYVRAFVCL